MAKLEGVPVERLEAALDEANGKTETKRLMAAIIYKRGPSVPMLAEWLDAREATLYRWFDRLESEPVARAARDRQRPGRPPKLDDERRAAFRDAVRNPPSDAGYDERAWTTELARRHLEDELDAEYSRRHVQRLLRDAGLTCRAPESSSSADGDDRTALWTIDEN